MFKESDYKVLASKEAWGDYGGLGIKILVASTKELPPPEDESLWKITDRAVTPTFEDIRALQLSRDPSVVARTNLSVSELLRCFPTNSAVFVERIPNGYSQDWYCRHIPWLIVSTPRGRFKVGWRRNVIHLEWTETLIKESAEAIFPDEDVTRFDRVIHAWGLSKLESYLKTLFSVPVEQTLTHEKLSS